MISKPKAFDINTLKSNDPFKIIYSTSQQYCLENGIREFHKSIKYSINYCFENPNFTKEDLIKFLDNKFINEKGKKESALNTKEALVFLLMGQTGGGKTTLSNTLRTDGGKGVEGIGIESETNQFSIAYIEDQNIYIIDCPGIDDTHGIPNKMLMSYMKMYIKKHFDVNAKLDAIFILWQPSASLRYPIERIFDDIEFHFGTQALKSVVFLINEQDKETSKGLIAKNDFFQTKKDKIFPVYESKINARIPVIAFDCKKQREEGLKLMVEAAEKISPLYKDEFEQHTAEMYYKLYIERFEAAEKQNKAIEKVIKDLELHYNEKIEKLKKENERDFIKKSKQKELEELELIKERGETEKFFQDDMKMILVKMFEFMIQKQAADQQMFYFLYQQQQSNMLQIVTMFVEQNQEMAKSNQKIMHHLGKIYGSTKAIQNKLGKMERKIDDIRALSHENNVGIQKMSQQNNNNDGNGLEGIVGLVTKMFF